MVARILSYRRTVAAMTLILALAGIASVANAQPNAPAMARAKRIVENNEKNILFIAHPSAKLQKLTFNDDVKTVDEFDFRFTCTFELDNGHKSKIYFKFDESGSLKQIKPVSSTGFPGAFTVTNFLLAAGRDKLLKEAQDNPDFPGELKAVLDDPTIQRAIREADAPKLLTLWIRIAEKPAP